MTLAEYRVRVVRNEAGLAQLEEEWTRLLAESRTGSIFASFPWNTAWWHAFSSSNRLYVLVASDASEAARGIAPLMLRKDGPLRRLEFFGTGLSDAGDFLLDAACAQPVAEAIFAAMRRRRRECDLLDLDEVPPYSPLSELLDSHKPPGLHLIRLPRTVSPFIPLPPTWEEYIAILQRKPRQHLESFSHRVVQETGAHYRCVTGEAEADEAVAGFYKLHLPMMSAPSR